MDWVVYNRMLIPEKLPHDEPDLTDLEEQLKISPVILARYTTDFDCGYETQWWYLIKDDLMDLTKLSTNVRNQIRKGLKHATVRKIDPSDFYDEMYNLFKLVISERPQHKGKDLRDFFNKTLTGSKVNVEVWGVFMNSTGLLVAYAINHIQGVCVNYREAYFNKQFHKYNVSNALFYTLNTYYLNEMKLKYVYDGERTINHPTTIQDYLIKTFGFRKAYCKLNIIYKNNRFYSLISLVFPLRGIFLLLGNHFIMFRNIYSLLKLEEIRRSFYN